MSTFLRRLALAAGVLLSLAVPRIAEAASLTLQWDANPEPGITGYVVSYGTRSGFYDRYVDVGNTTSLTLNLTVPGTTAYYFVVSAYSAEGTSDYSDEITASVSNPIPAPVLNVDGPSRNQIVPTDIYLSGWSADLGAPSGTGTDSIHVYAYPNPGSGAPPIFVGLAAYGTPRPDVAAMFGAQFLNTGFSLPIVGLAPGRYDLAVFARSTVSNSFAVHKVVPIYVAPSVVMPGADLYIDTPRTGDQIAGSVMVAGWAADHRAASGTGIDRIDIWAYPSPGSGTLPVWLGTAGYGRERVDVAALFGQRFKPTGYEFSIVNLAAGVYDLVAFPRSAVSGVFENPRAVRVTIKPSVVLSVDTPSNNSAQAGAFSIAGWSLDRRASSDSGIDAIHVWAYPNPGSGTPPVFVGATTTGVARPDVGAIFGAQYSTAGFGLTAAGLGAGVYDLVVFSHSAISGTFDAAAVVRVTIR